MDDQYDVVVDSTDRKPLVPKRRGKQANPLASALKGLQAMTPRVLNELEKLIAGTMDTTPAQKLSAIKTFSELFVTINAAKTAEDTQRKAMESMDTLYLEESDDDASAMIDFNTVQDV
jgi:hypothetical protein